MRDSVRARLVTAASIGTFLLAEARPAWADCANDAQCKGDRICEKGQCVSPAAKAPVVATPAAPLPPTEPPPAAPLRPTAVAPTFEASPPKPEKHRRTGLLVTGVVLGGAGAVALGGGLALYFSALKSQDCTTRYYSSSQDRYFNNPQMCDDDSKRTAGIGVSVVGGVLLAVGVPLFLVGLVKVPSKKSPSDDATGSLFRPATLSLAPSALGPAGYGLTMLGTM